MLAVLADFNAFKTTNDRPSWESTQGADADRPATGSPGTPSCGTTATTSTRARPSSGSTSRRSAPARRCRPAITRLPGSGQYYASPALAALLRTVPAGELGDRFPGRLAGTIGQRALTGPDELVIYVGRTPSQLAALPATTLVHTIAAGTGPAGLVALLPGRVRGRRDRVPVPDPHPDRHRYPPGRRPAARSATPRSGWSAPPSRQISVISSVEAAVSACIGVAGRDRRSSRRCSRPWPVRDHQRPVFRRRSHAHRRRIPDRADRRAGRRRPSPR